MRTNNIAKQYNNLSNKNHIFDLKHSSSILFRKLFVGKPSVYGTKLTKADQQRLLSVGIQPPMQHNYISGLVHLRDSNLQLLDLEQINITLQKRLKQIIYPSSSEYKYFSQELQKYTDASQAISTELVHMTMDSLDQYLFIVNNSLAEIGCLCFDNNFITNLENPITFILKIAPIAGRYAIFKHGNLDATQ